MQIIPRLRLYVLGALCAVSIGLLAQTHRVRLTTSEGDIVLTLFDDTPIHRDNFLKLVASGYYDGIIFHRVISQFMIQAGDSLTRHAQPGALYGEGDVDYTLPSEILFPKHYHHRGALAAAREGDDVNPERRSSGAQFYIVTGRHCGSGDLQAFRQHIFKQTKQWIKWPREAERDYATRGGSPHLDLQYTVFGEVAEGMEVVECIERKKTDLNDRPIDDVRILKAEIIE